MRVVSIHQYSLISGRTHNGTTILTDRRDYGRDRDEDRRDRDSRGSRRRDDRRESGRRGGEKERDQQDRDRRDNEKVRDDEREPREGQWNNTRTDSEHRETGKPTQLQGVASRLRLILTLCLNTSPGQSSAPTSRILTPARTDEEGEAEEGEEMDAVNNDDEDMSAIMGMTGFGSTKVIFLEFSLFSFMANLLTLSRVTTFKGTKMARPTSRSHELGDNT